MLLTRFEWMRVARRTLDPKESGVEPHIYELQPRRLLAYLNDAVLGLIAAIVQCCGTCSQRRACYY